MTQVSTVCRRAERVVDIGVEMAIDSASTVLRRAGRRWILVLRWPLTQASTVCRRAGRAVDIGVEVAIDSGQYSVEALSLIHI